MEPWVIFLWSILLLTLFLIGPLTLYYFMWQAKSEEKRLAREKKIAAGALLLIIILEIEDLFWGSEGIDTWSVLLFPLFVLEIAMYISFIKSIKKRENKKKIDDVKLLIL